MSSYSCAISEGVSVAIMASVNRIFLIAGSFRMLLISYVLSFDKDGNHLFNHDLLIVTKINNKF